jgi:ferredoxin
MEQLERLQSSEGVISDEVRECLEDCIDCFKTCTETLTKSLLIGGKHAKLEHLNLLMDCAKICSANADFILRNSTYYPQTCGITADICDECADMCERFKDDFMKECANACRRCAESCRELAR